VKKTLVAMLFVAGCTTVLAPMEAKRLEALTTSHLWSLHYTTAEPLEAAFIEAELASRGETSTYGDFIGRKTGSVYGKKLYSREAGARGDRNCSDFPSAASAQKFFLTSGGPTKDKHGLDKDGDGLACEWGSHIQRVAAKGPKHVRRSRSSGGSCHVGPRGGTYTISASGRKNYGGC
tara:strand:- start:888 stop:1418 length:531 start_codon:yes stop_codon:yes gene_type:complete